jgi:hypothetical protein
MKPILPLAIQLAGGLHLFVASANFILPGMLRYRENLARVPPIIRQIFRVHAFYIVFVLIGFGVICLWFPSELCGLNPLGRFVSGFLAVFWSVRVVVQLRVYDQTIKEEHPLGNFVFCAVFFYLAVVFAAATLLPK